ncbi:MAG: carbon-nitrogen family hydrolase [Proteobacteria bacterium]|nr:carbon-nitrogen family hydrolase [Pseudomonadota bacterium]
MSKTLVAAVQMTSTPDVAVNLNAARNLIAKAASAGARLVVLPENLVMMGHRETDKLAHAEADGAGPVQDFLAETARRFGVWLVGGTLFLRASPGKVYASSLVLSDKGERVGRYDKIHLFDVNLPGAGERYRESATVTPGDKPLVVDTPFGRLGVTICYDLRFPELYRQLADAGVEILAVPSAFIASTGPAHWEVLLRARAVENLAYVIASNQGGTHENGRRTYGNSMVIDPWGNVLARLDTEPDVVLAEIDLPALRERRNAFPVLAHRRLDSNRFEGVPIVRESLLPSQQVADIGCFC